MIKICQACGKIEGEHRGWDVSCDLNSIEVDEEKVNLVRDVEPDGRVVRIEEKT